MEKEKEWIKKTRKDLRAVYGKGRLCGVYVWTHKISNKKYVGSSTDIIRRLGQHYSAINNYPDTPFHKMVIELGGVCEFSFEVQTLCQKETILARERDLIQELKTLYPLGFNFDVNPTKIYKFREEKRTRQRNIRRLAYKLQEIDGY